ncbi:MAG: bacterial regulatory s, tetR family protein [Rhizorhabdus sp.]|nr:bacterial regulatory s, tetR family protein [Rhizorhabdus sp.]
MIVYKFDMGRSKTVSDAALLDLLLPPLQEVGPAGLSFSKASKAAGLSPASLVQRFGTRDAMIVAVLSRAWDGLTATTVTLDAEVATTPRGAIDLLVRLMPGDEADYAVGDGLLLLREDLRNPALRARGAAWGALLATALGRRLADDPEESRRLGSQMANVWQGALIWWGFTRNAKANDAVERSLEDWCRSVAVPLDE